jgi:hypothetical protein
MSHKDGFASKVFLATKGTRTTKMIQLLFVLFVADEGRVSRVIAG